MELQPKLKETAWNKSLEASVGQSWEKENIYRFDLASKRPIFVIDTPPPYPSGRPWHIGAAAHFSQIDMVARTARMMGHSVLFPIGIDRNGLPVELYTERKYNVHIQDVSREKFIGLCVTALDDLEAEMLQIMKSMGMSGDFENYYRTDSPEYRALTQATFIELWKKGLVYEDTRPNNFCWQCGTTIADAEILYDEKPSQLVYMRFKVVETGKDLIVASTRPELLSSCQIVLVNPEDQRYKDVVGKHALVPLIGREVKIAAHPYASAEFGTGVVMMCSYGDYGDVRIFRELGLQEVISVNKEGRMTKEAGIYAGLKIDEARRRIVEDLKKEGLLVRTEEIAHRTPLCERSKTPIEIIPMKEYYLKQLPFVQDVRKLAKALKFYPEKHRQILLNWIDSVTIDWPISRRRFYGTEIPIWYCKPNHHPNLPEPGRYYQPWKDPAPFKKCSACDSDDFVGDERTFDTWMDSSISPLFVSRYMRDDAFFKKTYPNTIRTQGTEIIRTWLYYTLLRCFQLTGKSPFSIAWISGLGVDEKGEKMSKSKGNVIDPLPILEKYGADTFRFWDAAEASLGDNFRVSEMRIQGSSKFLTKIWNVARFVSAFPIPKGKVRLAELDIWIMAELAKLVKSCMEGYKQFNFFIPANRIREFVWDVFAPHYLEMAKARAYGEGKRAKFTKSEIDSARKTLHSVFHTILLLLAPITPFITDHIWRNLYGAASIHTELFPEAKAFKTKLTAKEINDINSAIWKAKKDKGFALKAEVKRLVLPSKFKAITKDIVETHSVARLEFGKKIEIETA